MTVQSSASSAPEIEYLIDTIRVTEIPTNPNWREEADARIEKIRKGTITVKWVKQFFARLYTASDLFLY